MAVDSSRHFDVCIIGGGITGLAAAYRLAKGGLRVFLAEAANRPGGVITTVQRDGFLLEKGPNSFTSFPSAAADLAMEIGLQDRTLMTPMHDSARFVWWGGKLRKVPMSFGEFVFSDVLPMKEKWRVLRGFFKSLPPPAGDLTIGEYFRPRIGDAAVDYLLKPFMAGVYAADADRVSFEAALPKLFKPMSQQASMFRAMLASAKVTPGAPPKRVRLGPKSLVSFRGGLREFAEGIVAAFKRAGGEFCASWNGTIWKSGEGSWLIGSPGDDVVSASRVMIAASAPRAGSLLEAAYPETANVLRSIPYAGLAVVHVGLAEERLRERSRGFGFLTVEGHGVRVLGSIWSDRIFADRAPAGFRLLTLFYGGDKDPGALGWDDEDLRAQVASDLTTTMGYDGGEIRLLEIERWTSALPIFRVGHMRMVERLRALLPDGIELLGNYMGGVSIPDRVADAAKWAEGVIAAPRAERVPA